MNYLDMCNTIITTVPLVEQKLLTHLEHLSYTRFLVGFMLLSLLVSVLSFVNPLFIMKRKFK